MTQSAKHNWVFVTYKKMTDKRCKLATKIVLFGLLSIFLFPALTSTRQGTHESRIQVTFSDRNIPLIMCRILNEQCLMALDLGSMQSLALYEDMLQSLGMVTPVTTRSVGFQNGQFKEIKKYRMDADIMIGDVSYSPTLVGQITDKTAALGVAQGKYRRDRDGKIGVNFAYQHRLLLLFNKSEMIVDPQPKTLHDLECSPEYMIGTPLLPTEWIAFQVETDLGRLKLLLDTGCSKNLLNAKIFESSQSIEQHQIVVEGVQLGQEQWLYYDLPNFVEDFHGILGMDFLKHNITLIDYQNKMIYFKNPQCGAN